MTALAFVPTNILVAAFPQAGRAQISIRTAEVRARKAARPAAAPVPVLFRASPRPLARPVIPAGFLTAKSRVEFIAKWERPLVVAGKFDRAAIMKAAAVVAKLHQAREGGTWAAAMSVCLRAAWTVAKLAMHRLAH